MNIDVRKLGYGLGLAWALGTGLQAQAPATQPAAMPRPVGGDLLVAPTRLVFDARLRSSQLTLLNTGTAPATYRLGFIRMEMNDRGEVKEIPSDGPSVAEDMIRFAPQQITLEPGVQQTVRILVRRPPELPEGEYRAHLLIRAVPPTEAPAEGSEPTDPRGVAIRMIPVFGAAIPIIVRQGDAPSKPAFSPVVVARGEDGRTTLKFALQRLGGKESVFGNLQISQLDAPSKDAKVAEWRGVAVYPPLPARTMELPLGPLRLPSGSKLRLAYVHPERGEVLAETQVVLQ